MSDTNDATVEEASAEDAPDEGYIGVDPIYQNHAWDTEAPLLSGTKAEEVAQAWEESLPVKSVDLSVNPNAVSTLHPLADQVPPAFENNEDGTTITMNEPVLEVNADSVLEATESSDIDPATGEAKGDTVALADADYRSLQAAAKDYPDVPGNLSAEDLRERLEEAGVTEVTVVAGD